MAAVAGGETVFEDAPVGFVALAGWAKLGGLSVFEAVELEVFGAVAAVAQIISILQASPTVQSQGKLTANSNNQVPTTEQTNNQLLTRLS